MQKLMTLKFCDCFSETKQMAVIGKKTNKQKKRKMNQGNLRMKYPT